jgi:hypothetical protein
MMARSTTRSNQRPDTLMQDRICQVDETSCNARPDHTFGSLAVILAVSKSSRLCLQQETSARLLTLVAMGQERKEAAVEADASRSAGHANHAYEPFS